MPDEITPATNPYHCEVEGTPPPDQSPPAAKRTWISVLRFNVVCFTIVAPLLWYLVSTVANYKSDGDRKDCAYRTSEIANGLLAYHEENQALPPAFLTQKDDLPRYSWRVAILPYIGWDKLTAVSKQYQYDESWDGLTNRTLPLPYHDANNNANRKNLFHCPGDPGPVYETSYLAVIGSNTTFPGVTGLRLPDIPNTVVEVPPLDPINAAHYPNMTSHPVYSGGASNTVLFVESHNTGIHWMEPRDMPFADAIKPVNSANPPSISSLHPSAHTDAGAMVAFADGSVRWVGDEIDPKLLRSLIEVNNPDKPTEKWGYDR